MFGRNRHLHHAAQAYLQAPGSGMVKVVPPTRMAPVDGDEKRRELAKESMSARPYVDGYRAAGGPGQEMSALLQGSINDENELRKKFAQDRDHSDLVDPYVGLLPVHCCEDIFQCRSLSTDESAVPRAFQLASRRQGPAVVSRAEFEENFEIFTEGLLRGLNWDNVFAAGGSVLAALLPLPDEHRTTRQGKRRYFHHEAYTASDVDLFFYGLDEAQANEKLKEVYYCICDSFPDPSVQPLCFRTQHAVTIVSKFPYRHVQVVLRLYKSPAEVLVGFDVDACSVGYDGSNVWMTPRCHSSITAQYNTVDMTRRSPTYEVRLAKYAARGMEVAVPVLDRQSVDPQIYETPFEKAKGLMKLLLLEKLSTPAQRLQFKQQQRVGRLQPLMVRQGRFYNRLQQDMNDAFLQAQIDGSPGDVSDYQTVFLPWGPNWDANKVRNLVYTKDMLLNSTFSDPFRKGYRHPCFFGTAAEVLEDCSGQTQGHVVLSAGGKKAAQEEEEAEEQDNMVKGPLKWMTVDPGQQSVGSFHPITTGEWAEGVHLSSSTEHLVRISQDLSLSAEAAAAAVAGITPVVDSTTINMRDAAGRTPLMLAVLAGNVAAAEAFITHGALLNSRLQDGRTALHLAAQYGKPEVMAPLLKRGEVLNAALGEHLQKMEQEERALAQAQVQEEEQLNTLRENEGSGAYFRALHVLRRRRAQEAARRSAEREEQGYLDKLDLDGLDYDQKMSPLMYAAFFGHCAAAKVLLDAQADPGKMLCYEQNGVATVKHAMLTLACHNGHTEVFRLLLERRASAGPETGDLSARTPLHLAALWGEAECVRLLVSPREDIDGPAADPDAVDNGSNTALMVAVQEGHVEVVEILLAHTGKRGALGAGTSTLQKSPVTAAVEACQPQVLALLLQKRGDPSVSAPVVAQPHGGLFGSGFGSGFRSGFGSGFNRHGNAPKSTVLEWAEERLASTKAELAQMKSRGTQEAPQPHILPTEYFDFLLSRTPSGFERFALSELKRRTEALAEQEQAVPQQDSGLVFTGMFSSPAGAESTATACSQKEKTIEKLAAILQTLKEFGAKRQSDLEASAARSKSEPARKSPVKQARPRRGASPQQPVNSGVAFQLGIGSQPVKQAQPSLFGSPQQNANSSPGLSLSYSEHFEPVHVPSEAYPSLDSLVGSQAMQPRYKALFDAAAAGNVAAAASLCEAPAGEPAEGEAGVGPLLVAAKSALLGLTLLDVAVLQDQPEMVRCLLRLAEKQYTPEPTEEEANDEEVVFKDAQLVQLGAQDSRFSDFAQTNQPQLQQLREAQSFKRKGHKMLERLAKYKAEGQAAEGAEQLVSTCSVSKLLFGCGVSALQHGVQRRCYAAVEALLNELDKLDILADPGQALQEPTPGFQAGPFGSPAPAPDAPPPTLKSVLLRAKANYSSLADAQLRNMQLTAFEAAIAGDDVRMAELLLAKGAQDCLRSEAGLELPAVYTGLEVSGEKREDWALPRRLVLSRTAVRRDRLRGLHVAAAAGADSAVDFLLDGGMDSFAMVGEAGEGADAKEEVLGSLFSLEDRDDQSRTPLHYAVHHDRVCTLRKLLAIGRTQMKDRLTKLLNDRGTSPKYWPTPLQTAVSRGRFDCASALLEHKASALVEDSRSQTPLHLACSLAESSEQLRGVKCKLLDVLLDGAQAAGSLNALLACAGCGSTALHEAAKHQSQLTVEALLKRMGSLGPQESRALLEARDSSGQTALHIAVQHKGPGGLQVVRALLTAGADAGALAGSGSTPLHLAARAGGGTELLTLLLPPGAEGSSALGAEDAAGRTPLEWLMAAQLARLASPAGQGAGTQDAAKPRASESLALLAKAEAAGRRVVDPSLVRQHANSATAAAAASAAPQRQGLFANHEEEEEEEEDDEDSDN